MAFDATAILSVALEVQSDDFFADMKRVRDTVVKDIGGAVEIFSERVREVGNAMAGSLGKAERAAGNFTAKIQGIADTTIAAVGATEQLKKGVADVGTAWKESFEDSETFFANFTKNAGDTAQVFTDTGKNINAITGSVEKLMGSSNEWTRSARNFATGFTSIGLAAKSTLGIIGNVIAAFDLAIAAGRALGKLQESLGGSKYLLPGPFGEPMVQALAKEQKRFDAQELRKEAKANEATASNTARGADAAEELLREVKIGDGN